MTDMRQIIREFFAEMTSQYRAADRLIERLEQATEPVLWQWKYKDTEGLPDTPWATCSKNLAEEYVKKGIETRALYASPPIADTPALSYIGKPARPDPVEVIKRHLANWQTRTVDLGDREICDSCCPHDREIAVLTAVLREIEPARQDSEVAG